MRATVIQGVPRSLIEMQARIRELVEHGAAPHPDENRLTSQILNLISNVKVATGCGVLQRRPKPLGPLLGGGADLNISASAPLPGGSAEGIGSEQACLLDDGKKKRYKACEARVVDSENTRRRESEEEGD